MNPEYIKAVILAGGIGSRLGSLLPKCMTELPNGKTIIQNQIENLINSGILDITVVLGHKSSILMEHIEQFLFQNTYGKLNSIDKLTNSVKVKYVYNPLFQCSNTSKSLMMALDSMVPSDVIWMNGDVVFPQEALSQLLNEMDPFSSTLLVVEGKTSDEEIKYSLDKDGFVKTLSKDINPEAQGEAIGINFITESLFTKFKSELGKVDNHDYFEKALENLINDGHAIEVVKCDYECVEVDFKEDLEKVTSNENILSGK